MVRLCKKCNQLRALGCFYKNSVNPTGFDYYRKGCRKMYQKQRFQRVKKQEAAKRRKRYQKDIQFRLGIILRSRISNLFKTGSAVRDLGCSLVQLKSYLETTWQTGMSWNNYGLHGWHIDHILPLSKFDLADPRQFRQACHFTNLQALWASDNIAKGDL